MNRYFVGATVKDNRVIPFAVANADEIPPRTWGINTIFVDGNRNSAMKFAFICAEGLAHFAAQSDYTAPYHEKRGKVIKCEHYSPDNGGLFKLHFENGSPMIVHWSYRLIPA